MVKLIYGEKGNGKTKELIDLANNAPCDGLKSFITKTSKYHCNVDLAIKYINVLDYGVDTALGLLGFVNGMVASNSDYQQFYIDGIFDICKEDYTALVNFFDKIDEISTKLQVEFVLTISLEKDLIPDFIKKYL